MKSLAIEREFGSGGREIGMRVAELAGIPYYDGELLIKAAEAQGVSIELLKPTTSSVQVAFCMTLLLFRTTHVTGRTQSMSCSREFVGQW